MYVINGKFLYRNINGQIRVAIETIKELDKIVPKNYVEIIAPESNYTIDGLKNIPIRRIGKGNAHVWEQTSYYLYLLRNKAVGINFLNSHPILKPDIAYMHDVFFHALPNVYISRYGKAQKKFNLLMNNSAAKKAKTIITVSEFSRMEIIKYCRISNKRIYVIYNGWQHMSRVNEDLNVFYKFPEIVKGNYLMAASGITPQKNFQWILKNAKFNENERYVIVGQREKSTQEDTNNLKNVFYIGRVSDGELKALMHHCKAFVHPAIYEGFGMTPIEAIACGCKQIILSNASCLPEIYGRHAHYIDLNNPTVRIEEIINQSIEDVNELLEKYSWKSAALQLYEVMKQESTRS